MSFKIVIFAAAVFACQVNAQMGIIRPFATGFTNGLTEMAKPFVQLGQSVMTPASEYFSGRRPSVSQWMTYPQQMIPQAQAGAYEGFETISSAIPGGNYFQSVRPPTVIKPPTQYYPQMPSQSGAVRPQRPFTAPTSVSALGEEAAEFYRPSNLLIKPNTADIELPKTVRPQRPFTAPASVSALGEETAEFYRPSNLLMKPNPADIELPKAEGAVTLEGKLEIPSMQRPLPLVEDDE